MTLCAPTIGRLNLPFKQAVTEPATCETYRHLDDNICGDTTLEHYNTGRLPAKITAWTRKVRTVVRRAKAVTSAEKAEAALRSPHPPYFSIVYCFMEVLQENHASMMRRAQQTLAALLDEMENRMNLNTRGETTQRRFAGFVAELSRTLYETLSSLSLTGELAAYSSLAEHTTGSLALSDFDRDALSTDIHAWRERVTRVARKVLLGEPTERF